jgi:hypothetical protein
MAMLCCMELFLARHITVSVSRHRGIWCAFLSSVTIRATHLFSSKALFLTEISFNAKYANTNISLALDTKINALLATAYFTSFATTLVTTVLIAYRIHSISKEQGASSRRFRRIMDIVVQSGVIYALSQFTSALAGVVPGSGSNFLSNTRDRAFQDYAPLLNLAIAVRSAFSAYRCRGGELIAEAGHFIHRHGRSRRVALWRRDVSFDVSAFIWASVPRTFHASGS